MVGEMMENLPKHVGIIMDGNGRWAKEKRLIRRMGHDAGCKNLKHLASHIYDLGIKYLSIYAFSVDNFKRDSKEVNFLMDLFIKFFKTECDFLLEKKIKVVFSGRRQNLPKNVLECMDELTFKTKDNENGVLNVCLNYSGQLELIDMIKKVIDSGINIDDLTREDCYHFMYQDLPPLDFVIRTSGEQRISDFMLYQSSYAEYYFPKVYFPDFTKEEFDVALNEYFKRKRRFGGVSSEKTHN